MKNETNLTTGMPEAIRPTTDALPTPKIYGWWVVGGNFNIAVNKQLTPEQIKNTEELLGWSWKPNGE